MSQVYHFQLPLFAISKVCTECNIEKPLEEFYKAKRGKYGRKSGCKICQDTKYKNRKEPGRRRETRSKIVAHGNKWCSGCRTEQSIENFTTDRSKEDELSTLCHTCRNAISHNFLQNCSDASRELLNARARRWQRNNPLKRQEIKVRRRARQKNVTVDTVRYERILERDGMYCYICEHDILPGQKIDFDHVIPLVRGGSHSEDNIKVTHAICNRRKHDKLLEEMTSYQRRGTKR